MKHYLLAIMLMATAFINAQNKTANDTLVSYSGSRPDGHAPISIMGDHTHGKGEFMVSYRYMAMTMEDILVGDGVQDSEDLLMSNGGNYMVTPNKMPMQMHMLGLMYAPTHKLTLFAMANYVSMEMDHLTAMQTRFTTTSSGLGDTKLGFLYNFYSKKRSKLHANFTLSIPTGSIDNKDVTPASNGNDIILPYPMQIGSGTVDFEPGVTYLTQGNRWSFGSQLKGLFRVDDNKNGYALGEQYTLNSWFAVNATEFLSVSARLEGKVIENIEGANSDLNPNMIITADKSNSGGEFIKSGLGLNFYVPKGILKGLRLGIEYAYPIYQNVNGTQLQSLESLTAGVQYAF